MRGFTVSSHSFSILQCMVASMLIYVIFQLNDIIELLLDYAIIE